MVATRSRSSPRIVAARVPRRRRSVRSKRVAAGRLVGASRSACATGVSQELGEEERSENIQRRSIAKGGGCASPHEGVRACRPKSA